MVVERGEALEAVAERERRAFALVLEIALALREEPLQPRYRVRSKTLRERGERLRRMGQGAAGCRAQLRGEEGGLAQGADVGEFDAALGDCLRKRLNVLSGRWTRLGRELGLIAQDEYKFCWIVDFPMYEWNEDDKKIDFSHNPFSMPQYDRDKFLALDKADAQTILGLKAYQYDIVCNGYELSSGAIRNHDPDVMLKAFEIAGYAREETEERFKGMLNAFRYGAPPHGGTAPGIDRIVMLLAGEENLREVTMFPMTQQAQDLLMNAPSEANPKQLKELHLRVVYPEK